MIQVILCYIVEMAMGNYTERLRTTWSSEMDRYFIDLMLEQVSQGQVEDHLFSKKAWKHMSSKFNAKFNFQFEKDVLKNRHKTLRNLYRSTKNLLGQPGFSWDEKRNMVIVDDQVMQHPKSYLIQAKREHLFLMYQRISVRMLINFFVMSRLMKTVESLPWIK